jgi:hypothetical protein
MGDAIKSQRAPLCLSLIVDAARAKWEGWCCGAI